MHSDPFGRSQQRLGSNTSRRLSSAAEEGWGFGLVFQQQDLDTLWSLSQPWIPLFTKVWQQDNDPNRMTEKEMFQGVDSKTRPHPDWNAVIGPKVIVSPYSDGM